MTPTELGKSANLVTSCTLGQRSEGRKVDLCSPGGSPVFEEVWLLGKADSTENFPFDFFCLTLICKLIRSKPPVTAHTQGTANHST